MAMSNAERQRAYRERKRNADADQSKSERNVRAGKNKSERNADVGAGTGCNAEPDADTRFRLHPDWSVKKLRDAKLRKTIEAQNNLIRDMLIEMQKLRDKVAELENQ